MMTDDEAGVEAAGAAVYRSVASGADSPAGARRVEQGLRRLAAALDASSPAHRCSTLELLELLVSYVQAGTMIARLTKGQATAAAAAMEDPPGRTAAEAMDVGVNEPPAGAGFSDTDPAQASRVSTAVWRLADALGGDEGVVRCAGEGDAVSTVTAAVGAVRRGLASLPADHLDPLFPGPGGLNLVGQDVQTLHAVHAELSREYAGRKEMVARRAGVTVQSFSYSTRLKDHPEVARDFMRRAGAGGAQAQGRDALPVAAEVSLEDVRGARVADLARAAQRTNAEAAQVLEASVKRVLIGKVPDRGGRAEGRRAEAEMPAFAPRTGGGNHMTDGGGRGGGGGGRRGGGFGRGRGDRPTVFDGKKEAQGRVQGNSWQKKGADQGGGWGEAAGDGGGVDRHGHGGGRGAGGRGGRGHRGGRSKKW